MLLLACFTHNVGSRKEVQALLILTDGLVFATGTNINFTAVTEENGFLEYTWQFGDGPLRRIKKRSIIHRFSKPNRYNVLVSASNGTHYFTSNVHTINVQSRVSPNRLVASSSVLMNSSVKFYCRLNSGSDVSYYWNFGDGTRRLGNNDDTHVYEREGEYMVNVSVFNNVSSAFLTKHIFVVKEYCQPPPVKNMGPLKLQILRYEDLHMGVTFEAAITCAVFQGLRYHWSFMRSDGTYISLPAHTDISKQTIVVPAFFLDYGNYTAIARVQIFGTVIYSNYTVSIEVSPTKPVSIITDGQHRFIDKFSVEMLTLNGTMSFDPDNPTASLRFYWECATLTGEYCFNADAPNPLQSNKPCVIFPTSLLNDKYNQFRFTLSVSSGDRRSLNTETFLSLRPRTDLRLLQIECLECHGTTVNWNKPFSVQAVCMSCSNIDNITYKWKLFLINETEGSNTNVPFCRVKESMGVSSSLGTIGFQNETSLQVSNLPIPSNINPTLASMEIDFKEEYSEDTTVNQKPEVANGGHLSNSHMLLFDQIEEGISDGRPAWNDGSTNNGVEEFNSGPGIVYGNGDGGAYPQNMIENQTYEGETMSEDTIKQYGDNLVDMPNKAPVILHMINWSQFRINNVLFRSYSTSGITSKSVSLRPFVLKPSKMYMLEVSLESNEKQIGLSQLYFNVNEMSPKTTCHVQPRSGTEVFTIFSIFCTSGKEDLYYEFSYQAGNGSRKILYKGRDIQYYFNLPSGAPEDGYQVTIFTQITNAYGSQTQPCPVNVTVQPTVFSNATHDDLQEIKLLQEGLRNLSTLVLMRNHIEIRNYVVVLTTILNRLYTENDKKVFEFQSQIRYKLISIVQGLEFNSEDELTDIVTMLKDLFFAKKQLTIESTELILTFTKSIWRASNGRIHKKLAENLILLTSTAIEMSLKWSEMRNFALTGMDTISNLLLNCIDEYNIQHFNFSTGLLDLQTSIHQNYKNPIQTIGPVTINMSSVINTLPSTCYISQILYSKETFDFWTSLHFQMDNGFASLNLFDCYSKKRINTRKIVPAFTMKIRQNSESYLLNKTIFSLYRDKIHFHQFTSTPDYKHSALKIMVTFYKFKSTRVFPVLLLIRHSKKPSPVNFNFKQVHSSDKNSTQIFIPADSLKDSGSIYLALMDADYERHPKNKYISKMLQYTVDIQWTQCLSWHNGQWNSEDCSPQEEGSTAAKFVCSCKRLGLITPANRDVLTQFDMEDVSKLLSTPTNTLPCLIIGAWLVIYILLLIIGNKKKKQEEKKDTFVLLQDYSQNDEQQYAIMVKVGFCSRPQLSAKVYIVLYGKDGVSETQELFSSDGPLFERNSSNIFIMSVPDSLGPLQKIHVWHNNYGPSPSLYLSHIIIKDLKNNNSFFFYAECWLAIDEGDGKVERELTCLGHGLGFTKLFYWKFTEYMKDFHLWGSLFGHPSYSWFYFSQRITTCLVLCLGYMCLNIIFIHWTDDQDTAEQGLLYPSTTSLICGIQVTLAVYPVALFISLLFRYSKKLNKHFSEDSFKTSHMNCHNGLCLFDSFVDQKYTLPPWCVYMAYSLCAAFSLGFGTISVVIGTRLSPTKCVVWIHAVFFSMIYCIFILQPFLILLISFVVAWRKKDRKDFLLDELSEDIKHLDAEQYLQKQHLTHSYSESICETANFEKILAVRKRARFLRMVRPPTRTQLRIAREKCKRNTIIKRTLRELATYSVMSGMFMVVIMETNLNNQYLLTQTIRNELIRNPTQPFSDITTEEQLWNWSQKVFLNHLYLSELHNDLNTDKEVAPIQGNFLLIGTPIVIQFKSSYSDGYMNAHQIPGALFLSYSSVQSMENNTVKTTETQNQTHYCCGRIQCYSNQGPVIILGRLRTEASSALLNMRQHGWIDRSTRAIAVQFVLYNPPTNLFTMVSLLVESPVSGGIVTSSAIETLKIYRMNTYMDYFVMILQMVLLAMTFISIHIQMNSIIQKRIKNYMQDQWNCLEVSINVCSLFYFIQNMYYFMITVDFVEKLQKGFFREYVDFSLIADFQKCNRLLHGIILFFMTMKLIKMLRSHKMIAPCISIFNLSCFNSSCTMVAGIVFMLCFSFLGRVMLLSEYSFNYVSQSIQTTLMQFSKVYISKQMHTYSSQLHGVNGMLLAVVMILWTVMLKGVLTSVVKYSKKVQHNKRLVTFKEVASYARRLVISIAGGHKKKSTGSSSIADNKFYFDEFEDLIDELLFRLNVISGSLHHSLPAKSHCYTEEDEENNNFESCSNFSFKLTSPKTCSQYEDAVQNDQLENYLFTTRMDSYVSQSDTNSRINLQGIENQHGNTIYGNPKNNQGIHNSELKMNEV